MTRIPEHIHTSAVRRSSLILVASAHLYNERLRKTCHIPAALLFAGDSEAKLLRVFHVFVAL